MSIRQDIRFAVRSLARGRGATLVAMTSIAIGIAANATVFSLVQAVEFPTLIYPESRRVVFLESRNAARGLIGVPVSAPDAMDVATASRTLHLASLAADQTSILRRATSVRRVSGRRVVPTFFDVMRVPASLGRVLAPHDPVDVIVLSNDLWRAEFNADPGIVGQSIHLDGGMVSVVGVMPPRFDADSDFWTPLSSGSLAAFGRDDRQFTLFARLAPHASLDAASTEVTEISRRLALDHPATNRDWVTYPVALTRMHGRDSRGAFILLQCAVGFVLLIACANIANILLARGTRRRHEMAVRLALGASRGRLTGALLTESVLLSLGGGAIGVLLAMWGIRFARVFGGFPDVIDPTLNLLVLGFTATLSMLTGILSGIVPALRASATSPEAVLRDGGRETTGPARARLRSLLVAVQIAGAVVLSTCAALIVQTLSNLQHVELGFEPRGAIRADLALSGDRYRDPAAALATLNGILEHLRVPAVVAAGASTWALPTGAGAQIPFTLPSDRDTALPESIRRGVEAVTPSYFEALNAPLRRGRLFTDADREGAAPVAVVNEELARHLWPNRNPIGERLRLGAPGDSGPIVTVVGLVASIRRSGMHDVPVARAYVPFAQYPNTTMSIVLRARGDVVSAERALHDAVQRMDPSLFLEGVRTMEADLAQFLAPIRLITVMLGAFGLIGLLLAGLGVFGTMSYTVSQREREMAVRAALGAGRRDIFRLVFGSALRVTSVAVVAGVVLAVAAARALASFLYGVGPADPLTLAVVTGILTVVSLAACHRPARIAAMSDPMTVLRQIT